MAPQGNQDKSRKKSPSVYDDDDDEEEDDFQDAQETQTPGQLTKLNKDLILSLCESQGDTYIQRDIHQVETAISLFLNSNFSGAESFLKTKYGESLYYTFGYATISFLKAIMTFDRDDIQACLGCLQDAIEVSQILRKEKSSLISSIAGMFLGRSGEGGFKDMTQVEKHAELVWAEAYLIKALLSLLTDSNIFAFVREGLKMRSAYNVFKSGYQFILKVCKEQGQEGFKKNKIDEHFISGILFGIGTFQLILSMLPDRLIRLIEFIGMGGNRGFAMSCLETGAKWTRRDLSVIYPPPASKKDGDKKKWTVPFELPPSTSESGGLRVFLNELNLLFYHIIVSGLIQIPDTDLPLASCHLQQKLEKFPESFIFLALKARLEESLCHPLKADQEFTKVIGIQKDWRNLVHICIWDLGYCKMAQGHWVEAAECFDTLYKESKWSPAVYSYLKAACLYHADKDKYKGEIQGIMEAVPEKTRKIAGKSIPLEKFLSRKARKFILQDSRLLSPGYEVMYMWCGFDLLPPEQLSQMIRDMDKSISALEDQLKKAEEESVPYDTFYDDLCLAYFFKGLAQRELGLPTHKTQIPCTEFATQPLESSQESRLLESIKTFQKVVENGDDIELDHWMVPFARFEIGQTQMRLKNYSQARKEFKAAMKGGFLDKEQGIKRLRVSMEANLHLRAHNCAVKTDVLERIARLHGGSRPVENDQEDDNDQEEKASEEEEDDWAN